jgi:hypothetical protein
MENFWIPVLVENGYKKASVINLVENGYKKASVINLITPWPYVVQLLNHSFPHINRDFNQRFDASPCSTYSAISWFFKHPFVVGALPVNAILYFILGLDYDPIKDSILKVNPKIIISSGTCTGVITRIEKSEEIQRLIEAIPNDLALCLDIVWAKPLIETYFKKYANL